MDRMDRVPVGDPWATTGSGSFDTARPPDPHNDYDDTPTKSKCQHDDDGSALYGRKAPDRGCPGRPMSGRLGHRDQARSNRSRFMTLSHAVTKSRTNFSFASSHA